MSKLYDVQDALKTSLVAAVTALTTDNVIVDRQKDIDSEVLSAMRKATGLACVIGSVSAETTDPNLPGPRLSQSIIIELFFQPIISDVDNATADEIVEDILQHLHLLTLDSRAHMCGGQFKVQGYSLVPDEDYLRYSIDVETIIQL